jgi:hypothetical protein
MLGGGDLGSDLGVWHMLDMGSRKWVKVWDRML